MNERRYCLKYIITDKLILYFKNNIPTHSYNPPCLQDVWPAKQTGLIILFSPLWPRRKVFVYGLCMWSVL